MKTNQFKKEFMIWKTMQNFMVTVIFVSMIMACSKGDDPISPIDESTGTTGNTGGASQGIGVTVSIKSMAPETPASLKFSEDVEVTYDYDITRSDGARIWVYPYTNGKYTPNYKYELSPKFTGKGTKTVKFTITEGDSVVVDQLRIQIGTGGYTLLGTVFWDPLEDFFETVNYTFTN